MDKDKNTTVGDHEPTILPGPTPFEEELKDYSKTNEEDAIDNLPDSHPEPSPTPNTNART